MAEVLVMESAAGSEVMTVHNTCTRMIMRAKDRMEQFSKVGTEAREGKWEWLQDPDHRSCGKSSLRQSCGKEVCEVRQK